MILSSETYAKPVFHILGPDKYAAVLESHPYATPTFNIQKYPMEKDSEWRVSIEYDIGFTDNMLQRADVLEYMLQAPRFIDTTSVSTVRDTVTRLLEHWTKLFPRGVPDVAF